ncbi:MAG: HNH endonuclease [Planctomycetota bacterium]
MPRGRRWTGEELLLAMNLYCRLPFGKMHQRNPDVIRLAEALERTPGSVAMKLCNFASLDPVERERGVKGLTGAGKADEALWQDFEDDWQAMAARSEALWQEKISPTEQDTEHGTEAVEPPESERTERVAETRVRLAQGLFRRAVMSAYDGACCISGNPVPGLLIAAHIIPWSESPRERLNPRNGLCLSRLHEAAFDRGLITLDPGLRLVLSKELRDYLPDEALEAEFVRHEGHGIRQPKKFAPKAEFLAAHRENVYRD